MTPAEFTAALPEPERSAVDRITALYNAARYGGDASAYAELARRVATFGTR